MARGVSTWCVHGNPWRVPYGVSAGHKPSALGTWLTGLEPAHHGGDTPARAGKGHPVNARAGIDPLANPPGRQGVSRRRQGGWSPLLADRLLGLPGTGDDGTPGRRPRALEAAGCAAASTRSSRPSVHVANWCTPLPPQRGASRRASDVTSVLPETTTTPVHRSPRASAEVACVRIVYKNARGPLTPKSERASDLLSY